MATVKCQVCGLAHAMMECKACGGLKTCFVCSFKRHSLGSLKTHRFSFLHETSENRLAPELGDPCQWCEKTSSTVLCTRCDVFFCDACVKSFHAVGSSSSEFASHTKYYKGADSLAASSSSLVDSAAQGAKYKHKKSALSVDTSGQAQTLGAPTAEYEISPSSATPTSPVGISVPDHKDSSASNPRETFRLSSYGLGISDKELWENAAKSDVKYFISLDFKAHTMTTSAKRMHSGDRSLLESQTRSFLSIKQIVMDEMDQRHISIYFTDSLPVAQCLATNKDEGIKISGMLVQICRRESERIVPLVPEPPLFAGPLLKRGKLQWSHRWVVLEGHKFTISRSEDAAMPSGTILLTDTALVVESDKKKVKHFTIVTPSKKHTFKAHSEAERDTIVSLIERASIPSSPTTSVSISVSASVDVGAGTDVASSALSSAIHQGSVPFMPGAHERKAICGTLLQEVSQSTPLTPIKPKHFGDLFNKLSEDAKSSESSKIQFVEETSVTGYQPVPQTITHGVYRLMNKLYQSMQHGALITPVIYVPKAIWYQQGARLKAYQPKIEAFDLLQQEMLHMQPDLIEECDRFLEALLKFRVLTEEVQNRLSQHLSFIHSVKKSVLSQLDAGKKARFGVKFLSSIKKKVQRGVSATATEKIGDTTKYVKLLASVLQLSLLFENWISQTESVDGLQLKWGSARKAQVEAHLLAISEFFHAVVCNIVVREMKRVTKRYLKHCAKSLGDDQQQ